MKAKELIEILQRFDPETQVTVWDAYNDRECNNVVLSYCERDGALHIGNSALGEEVESDS